MEGFWLVELFSIVSSVLIGVSVSLGSPTGAIPEGRVHHIARAVIEKGLSWSIEASLVLDVLVDLEGSLIGEFP